MAKNIGREAMILKKRRKELGLTQTEVADAIGIQLQQYQMFAYGTRTVSLDCGFVLRLSLNRMSWSLRKSRIGLKRSARSEMYTLSIPYKLP